MTEVAENFDHNPRRTPISLERSPISLYEEHQNMIPNYARKFTQDSNLQQELIEEGNLAFCLARDSYNPSQAQFTTHFHYQLLNCMGKYKERYLKFHGKNQGRQFNIMFLADIHYEAGEEMCLPFSTNLYQLSRDSRRVIEMILSIPQDLFPETKIPTQSEVSNYLMTKHKWTLRQIRRVFKEIKGFLRELSS
jgi:hypothetical protein